MRFNTIQLAPRVQLYADRNETPTPFNYRSFGALRFLLALMVVVGHSLFLAPPATHWLRQYAMSKVAVMVFFVLSGYVIAEANHRFYYGKTGSFYINRLLRILPPYYSALIASLLLHALVQHYVGLKSYDPEPMGALFSAPNIVGNFLIMLVWHGLDGINLAPYYYFVRYLWALVIEMEFYTLAAILFYLSTSKNNARPHIFPLSFVVVIALYFLQDMKGLGPLKDFQYAPFFCFGMCLYFALDRKSLWAGAGSVVSLILLLRQFNLFLREWQQNGQPVLISNALLLLFALCVSIIPLSLTRLSQGWKKFDKIVGDLTYSLYLNHYVVLIMAASYFGNRGETGSYGIFLICVLSAILFAFAMNFVTEPYTHKLRDKVRGVRLGME